MKTTLLILLLAFILTSCDDKTNTISHSNEKKTELKKDTTKIEVADLPISIDSTDYLIHTIGYIKEYSSRFSSYKSESGYTYHSISNYSRYSINGNFSNIKFQHINSDKLTSLTEKIIEISTIQFLEDIRKQTGKSLFVYTLRDQDTNKDGKLNYNDVLTLYISKIDGSNLKKLTPELDQILDWKVITKLNRLYFKSASDTNKNGEFDKADTIHYYYINLLDPALKVIAYNPI